MTPTIVCDSREQKWDHVRLYLERNHLKWLRSKLPVGDYGRMDNLSTVIDRKASLAEVEGNLIQQHERFRAECIRAQENGIKLIVLVEAGRAIRRLEDVDTWQNPRLARWQEIDDAHARGRRLNEKIPSRPPLDGPGLRRIMETMQEKYGIEWRFCSTTSVGREICRLLGVDVAASNGRFVSL